MPAPLFSGNVVIPGMLNGAIVQWRVESLVLGDFTGDNRLDMVMGDSFGKMIFYRGRANWWEFDPPVLTQILPPLPGNYRRIPALTAADFNEDGNLDLALGDHHWTDFPPSIQRIHVMLGNGNGTFQSQTLWGPDTLGVFQLKPADFDGDGKLDLLYGSLEGPGILWGLGNGSFSGHTSVPGGVGRFDVGDIDVDGDSDLVIGAPQAAILRNNGSGVFTPEPLTSAGPGLNLGHTFGELNGDNWPDIVFASPGPEVVYVRLNDGTGQFLPPVGYPLTSLPGQTQTSSVPLIADLDGDGRAEVVIGRKNDTDTCYATAFFDQLLVFHNTGNGSLEPPVLYHIEGMAVALGHEHADVANLSQPGTPLLAAPDLSGDGRRDIVAANFFGTTLMLNDGQGGFTSAHGVPMGPSFAGACGNSEGAAFNYVLPGHVNNDGRVDLVSVRQTNPYREFMIMLQDAQGAFTTLFDIPFPAGLDANNEAALADVDRDGNLDIAVPWGNLTVPGDEVGIAQGNGDGTFQPWTTHHSVGKVPTHVAAADLNADTWPDLAVATNYGPTYPASLDGGGVTVLLNNTSGGFPQAVRYECGGETKQTAVADLDGDSDPDLGVIIETPSGARGARILLNDGNGSFTLLPAFYNFNQWGTARVAFADVNGDASPDMLMTIFYQQVNSNSGGIIVALNNGNASFQQVGHLSAFRNYDTQTAKVADLDGDGKADVVIACPSFGSLDIHRGHGDGTFEPVISYPGAGRRLVGGAGVILADFDNDGRLDMGSPGGCSPDSDSYTHLGFGIVLNRTCPACYPDCNKSQTLTVADFTCFQTKFVAGDPYADCNQSGTLTVADFTCFQTKFVQGCP